MPVIVESRFKVTAPEVPPPLRLVPATIDVINELPVPTALPFQYKAPPTLYKRLLVE